MYWSVNLQAAAKSSRKQQLPAGHHTLCGFSFPSFLLGPHIICNAVCECASPHVMPPNQPRPPRLFTAGKRRFVSGFQVDYWNFPQTTTEWALPWIRSFVHLICDTYVTVTIAQRKCIFLSEKKTRHYCQGTQLKCDTQCFLFSFSTLTTKPETWENSS